MATPKVDGLVGLCRRPDTMSISVGDITFPAEYCSPAVLRLIREIEKQQGVIDAIAAGFKRKEDMLQLDLKHANEWAKTLEKQTNAKRDTKGRRRI